MIKEVSRTNYVQSPKETNKELNFPIPQKKRSTKAPLLILYMF